MSSLVVSLEEERSTDRVLRTVHVRGAGLALPLNSFWYEFRGAVLPPPADRGDNALIAIVYIAMRLGTPVHVRGRVCKRLLANLEEFQDVWARWKPERYRKVPLSADEEIERNIPDIPDCAVLVFSGGVDSSFSLMRHAFGRAGRSTKRILTALLIHGFDISVADHEGFDRASESARATAMEAGVPLTTVRTNWRQVVCTDWEMEFGAGLASCLHHFEPRATAGLIGSDEDYGHLALP
jgi:hypothetical protein